MSILIEDIYCPKCAREEVESKMFTHNLYGNLVWKCKICTSMIPKEQNIPLYWKQCPTCSTIQLINEDTAKEKLPFVCAECKNVKREV